MSGLTRQRASSGARSALREVACLAVALAGLGSCADGSGGLDAAGGAATSRGAGPLGGGPLGGGLGGGSGGLGMSGNPSSGGALVATGGLGGSATGGALMGGAGAAATGATAGSPGGSGGEVAGGGSNTGGSGGGGGPESTVYLSDLCALGDAVNAWGPIEKDRSNGEQAEGDGGPISIGHQLFSKGLGTHAPSDVGFALGGNCTRFTATVGVDDEMWSAGSVVFEVWGDGARLYQSGVIGGAEGGTAVDVVIAGVQELRLIVSDNGGNGSDHADWGDARVTCSGPPLSRCERSDPPVTVPPGYHLAWSDEFTAEGRPSAANWSYEEGFVRNEEDQWYQADNARTVAGFLVIEGRREEVPNPDYQAGSTDWKRNRQYSEYTSSSLHTRGKQTWQYGILELRARIAARPGLWPAWWTLGVAGEWPSNGEIDIMEFYNNQVHANFAVGTGTRWQARSDSFAKDIASFGVTDWDSRFHVWRMEWTAERARLLLDGAEMNAINLDDMLNPDGQSPFRQPHYMLINLALGGTAGGDPSVAEYPTHYIVDYVRVFQED